MFVDTHTIFKHIVNCFLIRSPFWQLSDMKRILQVVLVSFFLCVGKWESGNWAWGKVKGNHKVEEFLDKKREGISDINDLSKQNLFSIHSVLHAVRPQG